MRARLLIGWLATVVPAMAAADAALDRRIEALVADVEDEVGNVPAIRAQALLQAIAAGHPPILLDTRSERERAVSTIAGAVVAADAIPAGASVVVYCTIGLRSGIAARELRARGVDALNLRGGILAWVAAGGTLVDANGRPTRRVHVYGRRWNAVPKGFEAVW